MDIRKFHYTWNKDCFVCLHGIGFISTRKHEINGTCQVHFVHFYFVVHHGLVDRITTNGVKCVRRKISEIGKSPRLHREMAKLDGALIWTSVCKI